MGESLNRGGRNVVGPKFKVKIGTFSPNHSFAGGLIINEVERAHKGPLITRNHGQGVSDPWLFLPEHGPSANPKSD
jgi:hypothetical protein